MEEEEAFCGDVRRVRNTGLAVGTSVHDVMADEMAGVA